MNYVLKLKYVGKTVDVLYLRNTINVYKIINMFKCIRQSKAITFIILYSIGVQICNIIKYICIYGSLLFL